MATYLDFVRSSALVNGGGPVTIERYKGDNSSTWKKGQLLKLASGVLTSIVTLGNSPVEIDTDDLASGTELFVAMADLDVASAGYQPVQRVLSDTLFEGPLVSSNAGDSAPPTVPSTIIGTRYVCYQDASGNWGVDKNDTTTPVVEIVDVEGEYRPFKMPDLNENSSGERYNLVTFKFVSISDI